jgi:predicted O-linked N-acetylglucosamine transferase (SPINDLY family)
VVGRPSDPPTRPPTELSTPAHILARFGEGLALHQQGRVMEAGRIYHEVLARQPDHFDALHLLGLVAAQTGQPERAVELIGRAIALNPNVPVLYSNLAKPLTDLGRCQEAIESCDVAIRLAPDLAGAYVNRGDALAALKRHGAALESYDKAIALDPAVPAAHNDRANSLQALNRNAEAVVGYDAAIALQPDYADAFGGRGVALQKLRRSAEALASYNRAIALNPLHVETYNNLGNLFVDLKRYDEAIGAYATAMAVKPDYPFLFGTWLHTRMKICDWFDLDGSVARLTRKLDADEQVSPPFPLLSLPTTLQQQRKGAAIWSATMFPPQTSLPPIVRRPRQGPLRVGYFSADFYNHATAWLIAGLFEQHDRAKVEPIAFSFDSVREDEMARRLSAGVDRFIDVSRMSDLEVASLARSLEIDIAVDLKGFTTDSRTGIFAARAAPIQVNYLGYPGTMAADYIDYLIADPVVVPMADQGGYSEKIVHLPDSYQVNDSRRVISDRVFDRAECGLPADGVVFCCFNNNYKITPDVFDVWMRLLLAVEGSVLWLLAGNTGAPANLRAEAERRGVRRERLIFAERIRIQDHLARHRAADLFLDTRYYNAHTTAADALWAGLPVLTCAGDTFASRVAGSLLMAVGLPELVTSSMEEYQASALMLARTPSLLAELKQRLAVDRTTHRLFDTVRTTRHIEQAYVTMWERSRRGQPPESFAVAPIE